MTDEHAEVLQQIAMAACMVVDMNERDPEYPVAKEQLKALVDQWRTAIFSGVRDKMQKEG